jgi:uncharacterized peroxidase-related enzyme
MAYIALNNPLPGITGLLENRPDTGQPIRELTQILLRGESTMSELERELIATLVSYRNECRFCTSAHSATVMALGGTQDLLDKVFTDLPNAPLSDKMKTLLVIAGKVQQIGKSVTEQDVQNAKAAGASDIELHDTVLIAALFCLYNRYVDGLGTFRPEDPAYYEKLAQRLVTVGYMRPREPIVKTGEAAYK